MNKVVVSENTGEAKPSCLAITVRQFAERMQISMPTAYAMTRRPGFPLLPIGRKKLVLLAPLDDWLRKQVCDDGEGTA